MIHIHAVAKQFAAPREGWRLRRTAEPVRAVSSHHDSGSEPRSAAVEVNASGCRS